MEFYSIYIGPNLAVNYSTISFRVFFLFSFAKFYNQTSKNISSEKKKKKRAKKKRKKNFFYSKDIDNIITKLILIF